jgi:translocator assembly and maintenance protein 41
LQHWGPGLFFHPFVRLPCAGGAELEVKYGVISDKALLQDLNEWTFLYMAGRLHKPCVFERQGAGDESWTEFLSAVDRNRLAALSAALLLGARDEHYGSMAVLHFLRAIVRLSYDGDIRVGLAENPKKVDNIVHAQRQLMWQLYAPLVQKLGVDVHGTDPASEAPDEAARLDFSAVG